MIVLGIDTSTLRASVALLEDPPGGAARVLASGESDSARHSDNLLPLIDRVLAEAGRSIGDVEAIAVGVGPGSFTGLRIGMATAKGLAFSTGVPLWAASSLAALAQDAAASVTDRDAIIVAVLDARRDEIFAGAFRAMPGAPVEPLGDEVVLAPSELASHLAPHVGHARVLVAGDAIAAYPDALAQVGTLLHDARATPSAGSVAMQAAHGDRADILHAGAPAYIRKSEAELKFPDGNPGPSRT